MKRIFSVILLLTVCSCLIFCAGATAPYISDDANVIGASSESELEEKITDFSKKEDFDIVIVTVDSIAYSDILEYAEDCYEAGGYADDGIILVALIADTPRYGYVTFGNGNRIFDDDAMDRLDEAFVSTLRSGYYSSAFHDFVDEVTNTVSDYSPISAMTVILALAIGALLAWLIPMNLLKGQLRSVRRQAAAESYVRSGSMVLTQERDLYLYRNIVRTAKPKANSSSGGTRTTSGGNRGRSG